MEIDTAITAELNASNKQRRTDPNDDDVSIPTLTEELKKSSHETIALLPQAMRPLLQFFADKFKNLTCKEMNC